ncbi:MAG TPA: hypothetical protein PLD23_20820 [Armatimonadota bacterium]|nr:hypothetical protein [Armatimonadota bacterium]
MVSVNAPRSIALVALVAGFLATPSGLVSRADAEADTGQPLADAADGVAPAAYVVSFRFIKVEVAEGLDPREFADIRSGAFSFAPEDGDGFYDRKQLAEAYGPKIRPGLVATVGPVYSMCVRPNADPKVVSGITGDGKHEWSVSASVEPLTPDGKQIRLHSGWDLSHVFGVGDGGMGTSDHWLGYPLPLYSGNGTEWGGAEDPVGTRFQCGWTVLVLIEKAVP